MATNTISSTDVEKALSGVTFPVGKQDLIKFAKNNSANNEVVKALNGLPNMDFNSAEEVIDQLDLGAGSNNNESDSESE